MKATCEFVGTHDVVGNPEKAVELRLTKKSGLVMTVYVVQSLYEHMISLTEEFEVDFYKVATTFVDNITSEEWARRKAAALLQKNRKAEEGERLSRGSHG